MKKAFEGFNLSEEEKEQIVDFIKDAIELGYEELERLKKERVIPGWGIKIAKFSSFAKKEYPELLEKFNEVLIAPDILKRVTKEEGIIKGRMKEGKRAFIEEHYIDSSDYDLVTYKKIRMKEFQHKNGENEKVLLIAIPYMKQGGNPRPGFGHGILISSLHTPQIFADFMADVPQFTGDTNLVSNKNYNAN